YFLLLLMAKLLVSFVFLYPLNVYLCGSSKKGLRILPASFTCLFVSYFFYDFLQTQYRLAETSSGLCLALVLLCLFTSHVFCYLISLYQLPLNLLEEKRAELFLFLPLLVGMEILTVPLTGTILKSLFYS